MSRAARTVERDYTWSPDFRTVVPPTGKEAIQERLGVKNIDHGSRQALTAGLTPELQQKVKAIAEATTDALIAEGLSWDIYTVAVIDVTLKVFKSKLERVVNPQQDAMIARLKAESDAKAKEIQELKDQVLLMQRKEQEHIWALDRQTRANLAEMQKIQDRLDAEGQGPAPAASAAPAPAPAPSTSE
jgi:cell division protein FtsB